MFSALVLSLPTRNSTLRMRVWRALKDCGAAVLRDGVYLLPQTNAFGRLEKEIRAHGGFAMTFDATPHAADDLEALRAHLRPAAGEQAVLVNVWATWCSPCVAEMPELVEIAKEHADDGVRVVAISIDLAMPTEIDTAEGVLWTNAYNK